MRLLDANNSTFKEFLGQNVPKYAIVSHRWGDDEPSYRSFLKFQKKGHKRQYQTRRLHEYGWIKVQQAAALTRRCGLFWLWIDTVCIDKDSSAELSEAINSMYNWYKASQICFVFLPDVHNTSSCKCSLPNRLTYTPGTEAMRQYSRIGRLPTSSIASLGTALPFYEQEFKNSCWFTRSWSVYLIELKKSCSSWL